jgi:hypothetical protein
LAGRAERRLRFALSGPFEESDDEHTGSDPGVLAEIDPAAG